MLDIQAELHELGQPYQELYEAVADLKRRHDLHPCAVRPRDGMSLRSEGERETVQDLVARFRRLPEDTRRRLPALWNSLAQLEIVIGDLEAGQNDFQEVAGLVSDPISRAEAHHNVYRAALERRDWDSALISLRRAVALDPEAFEPFPFARYEPRQILGAGGAGVSFLCTDRTAARSVVVKALRTDALDRDADTLLPEAQTLQEIDHPGLVRVLDVGHGGPEESRPYLVLEHFPGLTLSEHVARNGPFSPEDWLEVCWPIGRALQALHARGILHRCLRPGCVLLRASKTETGATRMQVKVLDTGLPLRRAVIHACTSNPEAGLHSGLGRSVARFIPFASPEVIGRPKGQVWVGPHSDLFSFGKLCAYGLTGRPDPDAGDRLLLGDAWQKLLDDCTAWTINRRLAHMGIVMDRIAQAPGAGDLVSRIERELHETTIAELTAAIEADPTSAAALIDRANAHIRQSNFAAAIADCTEALRLQPDNADVYRRRAAAHSRAHNPDGTIADCTEALRLEPRNLEALANRGLAHVQKGQHDRAIADYTEGLRLDPHDEVLYCNRGNAWLALGDLDRAVADYSEALRLEPRNLWTLGNRGKAHALRGSHMRAIADFTRILQLDPNNVRALADRAASHLDLGRPDRAIADYSAAIRQEPTAVLHHDRGIAHFRAGDLEQAIGDFTEALALAPDNTAPRLARARACAELGRSEEALADFSEVLRLDPQSATGFLQRGTLHVRLRKVEEALADLGEALRLKPSPEAHFQRGNAHALAGDQDRAIADFTQAIHLDPPAAAALTNRGNSYARMNDLEHALADFDRALELAPNDVLTRVNRAAARVRVGQIDEALSDYSEALRLDPANARAYSSRGLLLAARGELDRALADFDHALRLEPDNPRLYNHRGHVRAERGEHVRAIADFGQAIRLDPTYAAAWYNRGIAHGEHGDHEQAVADFSETVRLEPANAGALTNLGIARRRLGDRDGALADFTAAIAADPALLLPLYNRASLLSEGGDLDGALADLDEVLRREPDDVGAYISRGRLHSLRGEPDRAIADNLQALQRAPDDPRIANNLAWLLATCARADLRDPPRALEFAQKACAAGEDSTRLDTLAAAQAACGQFEQAVASQQRALDLAPEDEKSDFRSRLDLYQAGTPYVQR